MSDFRKDDLKPLPPGFFDLDVESVAKNLIGTIFLTIGPDGILTGGEIIETEAYDQNDPAAHCYCPVGDKPSNLGAAEAMFLAGGSVYVFGTQNGWCVNFVSGQKGFGSGVLIRALRPTVGLAKMRQRHGANYESIWVKDDQKHKYRVCQGPELLCVALGINNTHQMKTLAQASFALRLGNGSPDVVIGPRVRVKERIDKRWPSLDPGLKDCAVGRLWRFADYSSKEFLSETRYQLYRKIS